MCMIKCSLFMCLYQEMTYSLVQFICFDLLFFSVNKICLFYLFQQTNFFYFFIFYNTFVKIYRLHSFSYWYLWLWLLGFIHFSIKNLLLSQRFLLLQCKRSLAQYCCNPIWEKELQPSFDSCPNYHNK